MSSDGAWIDDGQFITQELKTYDGDNPTEFSKKVADEALKKYESSSNDDITVLTAVVHRNN